ERKRAKRLWQSFFSSATFRKGPRPAVDSALVLYNARVIEDGCDQPFKFERNCGPADGPMLRALVAALDAQRLVAGLPQQIISRADNIAEIIGVMRKANFKAWCQVLQLTLDPEGIAADAETFRFAIGRARAGPRPRT